MPEENICVHSEDLIVNGSFQPSMVFKNFDKQPGNTRADEAGKSSRGRSLSLLKARVISSAEGQILLLGCVVLVIYMGWLTGHLIWEPLRFRGLLGMTMTHALFGRAAGLSFGYTLGLSDRMVIAVNLVIETLVVLLFYPLFVFSWKHLVEIRVLQNMMERTRKAAEAHRPLIRRYGIIALFAFVWLPFWMTGPLVGCVIGFLIKLHPWLNVTIVLSGTYLAILCWAFLLQEVYERIKTYSAYAPLMVLGCIILGVVIGHFIRGRRQRRRNRQE